jgi:hypothetical protein
MTERLEKAYQEWNTRVKEFIQDMAGVFGRQPGGAGLLVLQKKVETYCGLAGGARQQLANQAWPVFNEHRDLIAKRNTDVFFKHDVGGLKAEAKLDVEGLWAKASVRSREAMWNAIEDLLDLLDEINTIRPIPVETAEGGDDANSAKKKGATQPKYTHWLEVLNSTASASGADEFARKMMTELQKMIGGEDDPELQQDFEQMMSKINSGSADDATPTVQDQEVVSRILGHFIDKIAPGAAGGRSEVEEEKLARMTDAERKAEEARRQLQAIQGRKELTYALAKLTQVESLQKTTDPTILDAARMEAEAEQERAKNPARSREFTITAHFNHKLLLFLNKLLAVRGNLKSKKDGSIVFPGIRDALTKLLAMFKENPGTEVVIRPIGEWVVAHKDQLLLRDDQLFLQPDHPFLVEFQAPKLWSTFRPHEKVNFWGLIGHPLQMATIFHHLDSDELRDIADIINELLEASQVSYKTDPGKLDSRKVITDSIVKGTAPLKLAKIRRLFDRMTKEPGGNTLRSLAKLLQDVLPQAAGLRAAAVAGTTDDDGGFDAGHLSAAAGSAEDSDVAQTFQRLLSSMPNPTPSNPQNS